MSVQRRGSQNQRRLRTTASAREFRLRGNLMLLVAETVAERFMAIETKGKSQPFPVSLRQNLLN